MGPVTRRTLESGVPQLDVVLGGGIPRGDLLLVVGAPGSGKTTLVCQVAFHAAKRGQNVLFVSTLSEPASRLVKHLRTLSFWDDATLGRHVFFESIFPVVRNGVDSLVDALVESVRSHKASLIVLDGFASLRDLHPDSRELRTFVNQLAVAMSSLDCTTLVTSSDVPDMRSPTSPPEFTMSDSIVELSQSLAGAQHRRTLRAWKVRGAEPLLGPHAFRITQDGLKVFPRISTRVLTLERDEPSEDIRVSWGQSELDVLTTGGLPRGSSTIVAGVSGTGKTLLALQYLLDGAARGEPGLLVSFRESRQQLVRKAGSFDLDLATPLADGRITIMRRLPVDLEIDELLHHVWSELERTGATRLVFDSVSELEHALTSDHKSGSLAVFMELARVRGVTSVMVRAVGSAVGPELEFAASPLEVLAENVLLLRNVQLGETLFRVLSVLKMREAAHDASSRQYALEATGFRVLPATGKSAELLRRLLRQPSENRAGRHEPASREAE
jgi:circadian clock protein KaiC